GDGILTALEVLHLVKAEGRRVAELAAEIERWPAVQRAVKVARRGEWQSVPEFWSAYERASAKLASAGGRRYVRPSGTEPVLRILVESRTATTASSTADGLARVAEEALR